MEGYQILLAVLLFWTLIGVAIAAFARLCMGRRVNDRNEWLSRMKWDLTLSDGPIGWVVISMSLPGIFIFWLHDWVIFPAMVRAWKEV
jgi:hypothetical protein